jgi:hypothetical protein
MIAAGAVCYRDASNIPRCRNGSSFPTTTRTKTSTTTIKTTALETIVESTTTSTRTRVETSILVAPIPTSAFTTFTLALPEYSTSVNDNGGGEDSQTIRALSTGTATTTHGVTATVPPGFSDSL